MKIKEGKILGIIKFIYRQRKVASSFKLYITGKRHWKQLFNQTWKINRVEKRVKKLRYKLYELGFTHAVLKELQHYVKFSEDRYLVRSAAWELALWYANKQTVDDAKYTVHYLSVVKNGEKSKDKLRRIAILEAESIHLLGESTKGKQIIHNAMTRETHPDLYLAAANLETVISEKIKWINKAFNYHNLSDINLTKDNYLVPYDGLSSSVNNVEIETNKQLPKVSIIMPVYNGAEYLQTSLKSILGQTWKNLELIVVDDSSKDTSRLIIEEYMALDNRVKLITLDSNSGAYVARNRALTVATGEFVTVNDVDDWSHPQKIETQVRHMMENDDVIANTSQQARATDQLSFFRRGKPGGFIFSNLSSLMFRREKVIKLLGSWDSVRFGADGEFKKRLILVFGAEAVVDLATGPLSFQRQSNSSLTGNKEFGYHGYFMGARKAYHEAYSAFHEHNRDYLYYSAELKQRPFAVPDTMLPKRENAYKRKHFDVIIASEFRLQGGTNMSNIEEIKAQNAAGLTTGLIQLSRFDFESQREMNYHVRNLIDGEQVQLIVYGESVSCDLLIVRHPPVLQEWQRYLPNIDAKSVKVIINQPPKRDYSKQGVTLYEIKKCVKNLYDYTGSKGKWYPIGPQVRDTLNRYHSNDLKHIKLSTDDWVNIIDVNEWKRDLRTPQVQDSVIKIGRHSRSQYVKWPNTKSELLELYPPTPEYEVHILGGAESPRKLLGKLPDNWKVYEFGEMEPKEFLKDLDVFVYYTHPDWVEAFGRVIFEAMAVGVPVIIHPKYQTLFSNAAIYAEVHEVKERINELMNDSQLYEKQVKIAHEFVERNFGHSQHISRLSNHVLKLL
ncbi:glycosyl transferase family A [Sutcliffiella horikoshii]|uniref:Glycosyl transferase family A n=2 Tax=Sutcliffiella horikoshii TaxID=79883 RepID=A0ABM6KR91_9BACI|nr:glycosyl transferase family A [Sutcliffiella horikoshii]